jgi:hypothetical protein
LFLIAVELGWVSEKVMHMLAGFGAQ